MTSLFSGADISGRDELFSRGSGTSLLDEIFDDLVESVGRARDQLVARVATSLTVAAVALTSTAELPHEAAAEIPDLTLTLRDESAQRIRAASSQSTQPNELARSNALEALNALRSYDLEPQRIVGDPDGGIALYVFGGKSLPNRGRSKFARVLATNEGDIVAMCSDDAAERPRIWADDGSKLGNTASRIQSFISG
ncbi:MAG TPA: hypothetical protein VGM06_25500 [Polyangiaceae bacterium]|jgi:hypothetical protein